MPLKGTEFQIGEVEQIDHAALQQAQSDVITTRVAGRRNYTESKSLLDVDDTCVMLKIEDSRIAMVHGWPRQPHWSCRRGGGGEGLRGGKRIH
jgi:hypothetical protein